MDIKGKKILVVGLGISGFEAANLLFEKGAKVAVTESLSSESVKNREGILLGKGVKVETGGHTRSFSEGCDAVIVSPGVDKNVLHALGYKNSSVPIIGELELGCLFCKAPITAITGTNGKTTVTSLMGEIYALAGKDTIVCGNIGNPLSGEISKIGPDSQVVLEVSSFQLETIKSFRPHVAVLLNVTDDHYDRHGGFENYKAQKFKVFSNQKETDWAILHGDFEGDAALNSIKSKILFYGAGNSRYRAEEDRVILFTDRDEKVFITADETDIKGRHNMENIACCCQIAEIEGISPVITKKAIKDFRGLEHRFQKIASYGGIEFIDDSKATNVDATKRALESIDRRVALIAGGRDKLGDYMVLADLIKNKVSVLVVIGEASDNICKAFSGLVNILRASSMEDAVKKAVSLAKNGEAVMLSPMCSSFDMFDSYAHRGRVFREAVKKISLGCDLQK